MGTEERQRTEKPEVTDEHKKKAKEMARAYDETRPTSTLPGSGGTVGAGGADGGAGTGTGGMGGSGGPETSAIASTKSLNVHLRTSLPPSSCHSGWVFSTSSTSAAFNAFAMIKTSRLRS